ncbi:MAG: hypothetical protein O2788_01490 [Chloroflexi bacterium]|nr:hypothetical protein [Chloroflexota bacterium]
MTVILLYVTAAISVVALAALVLLYISFAVPLGDFPYGPTNDVLTLVHYAMLAPIVLAVHGLVKSSDHARARKTLLMGMAGIGFVVLLQLLLVTGVLPFEVQVLLVIPAFLLVLYWYIVAGSLGRESGALRTSRMLDVLAGLYVGYPFWAWRIAKTMRASELSD